MENELNGIAKSSLNAIRRRTKQNFTEDHEGREATAGAENLNQPADEVAVEQKELPRSKHIRNMNSLFVIFVPFCSIFSFLPARDAIDIACQRSNALIAFALASISFSSEPFASTDASSW